MGRGLSGRSGFGHHLAAARSTGRKWVIPTYPLRPPRTQPPPMTIGQLVDRLGQLRWKSGDANVVSWFGHFSLSPTLLIPKVTETHCHPSRRIKVKRVF